MPADGFHDIKLLDAKSKLHGNSLLFFERWQACRSSGLTSYPVKIALQTNVQFDFFITD